MGGTTSPSLPIRDAFSQEAADTTDLTVRCDWLQVASFCIIIYTQNIMLMLMRSSLAGFLVSFIVL